MRKIILSALLVLSMSTAITTPSQAGWSNGPSGLFWCNNNGGCVKKILIFLIKAPFRGFFFNHALNEIQYQTLNKHGYK